MDNTFTKRQNTVKSSKFGAEFVALRIVIELIISMRYKLQMIGIPIDGAANVFCDNDSVYKNESFAEYRLKKKHKSICFHRTRECMDSNIIIVHKFDTEDNLADLLTKSLPSWKRIKLRSRIIYSDNTSIL